MSYIKKYSHENVPSYWHNFLMHSSKNGAFRIDELYKSNITIINHVWAEITVDFKSEENYFLFKMKYS